MILPPGANLLHHRCIASSTMQWSSTTVHINARTLIKESPQ